MEQLSSDWKSEYNWVEAFGGQGTCNNPQDAKPVLGFTGSLAAFTPDDVAEVKHFREGENDERNWWMVCLLKDGRWALIDSGCDYTGWDCQSSVSATVADSYESLCRWGLGREMRELWGIEIAEVPANA